jgi:hypothetical protein
MLLAAVGVAVRLRLDPDLWGHLRFGLDLLDSGLPTADPYSFLGDVPWINHEWLSEGIMALAYRWAGILGLLILKCVTLGSAFAAVVSWARDARPELRGWLLAAAFVGLFPIGATLRPQLWSILGVALLCAMLSGRLRLLWMPLVFACWANLHGGWIVGAGITGLWIAGRLLDTRSLAAVVPTSVALAVSLLATLANPYGWRLWEFLLATVRMSRPDIGEWAPYWTDFGAENLVLLPLSAAILVATLALRWRATTWARLLPALWLVASGLWVVRLGPFAGMLVLFSAVDAWRREGDSESEPGAEAAGALARRAIDAAVLLAASVPILVSQVRCLPIADDSWTPDRVAAGALAAPSVKGRLLLEFDWGEYAIWHWGRKLLVSTDGRRETIYSQAAIERHIAITSGSPEGLAYLDQLRPEYAWIRGSPERSPLGQWLLDHGYRIDVRSERSFVAARADLPVLEPGTPLPACFP